MDLYLVAKDLGLAPAVAFAVCYLHFLVTHRAIAVECVAHLKALVGVAKLSKDELAQAMTAAEEIVPRAANALGLFEQLRRVAGRSAIALLAIGLAVACATAASPRVDVPRVHKTLVLVQRALELELAATAPVSTAHALHREELRADVAAAVSATDVADVRSGQ